MTLTKEEKDDLLIVLGFIGTFDAWRGLNGYAKDSIVKQAADRLQDEINSEELRLQKSLSNS